MRATLTKESIELCLESGKCMRLHCNRMMHTESVRHFIKEKLSLGLILYLIYEEWGSVSRYVNQGVILLAT